MAAPPPSSSFLLVLCQPGAERALKVEAQRAGLVGGFQRPGMVTLKRDTSRSAASGGGRALDVDTSFPSIFARHVGLSLGKIDTVGALVPPEHARRLHVVALDEARAEEAVLLRERYLAEHPDAFRRDEDAKGPEQVLTAVLVDDAVWLSLHRASAARTPFPGGRPRIALPEDAPSRAWLKLEEATRLFEIPFAAGQRALELGSAPGGATKALLDRGLEVVGVDPNEMHPAVAAHERFAHIQSTSTRVDPERLERYDWLLLDVNVPARTALDGALPFLATRLDDPEFRGFVFTVKMKDWKMASEMSDHVGRIRDVTRAAFVVDARQLWSNGQEICVVGLRRSA